MFESLSKKLTASLDQLFRKGTLNEADIDAALREVRIALLEADVALPVVRSFIADIKEKIIGEKVIAGVSPGNMVIKLVYDALVALLGGASAEINLAATPPAVILMVGLQGSGKTTTTGKLAKRLREKHNKRVLVASLDVYRPAAQQQLASVAETAQVDSLPIVAGEMPQAITKRALDAARKGGFDVLLLDTAGRLHVDAELMDELKNVKQLAQPVETLLVADAMTGQDAVNIATAFHETIGITGIVLTRLDGDARGGAALSMHHVTGQPIKFAGMGEKLDALEPFHPERIASRILDKGDIVSFVEKASVAMQSAEAEASAKRAMKGQFDMNDMLGHIRQIQNMGGIGSVMNMMPGMGKMKDAMQGKTVDDSVVKRQEAIILSMTAKERANPDLLNASRRRRIATGAGTQVQQVNQLVKQYQQMETMMKQFRKLGAKGMMNPANLKRMFGG